MWSPVARLASAHLTSVLRSLPVAVVLGPRQTGKTTLKQQHPLIGRYPQFTLDRTDTLALAAQDPEHFLETAPELVLEHVQRLPALFAAIGNMLDRQPRIRPGQIVLLSSVDLRGDPVVEQGLKGRAGFVTLWPLTRREILGMGTAGIWSEFQHTPVGHWLDLVAAHPAPHADWKLLAVTGAYPAPALVLTTPFERAAWYQSYLDTYLSRDLPEITAVENRVGFHHLMQVVCRHIGQTVNQAAWARDAGGIIPVTARRYLDRMERSFQLIRIPAFDDGRTHDLVKAPKAFWSDTAIAMTLAGVKEPTGAHLENMILNDLVAWRDAQSPQPRLFHWRTRRPDTVDLVVEFPDGTLLAVDVRIDRQVGPADAAGLVAFGKAHKVRSRGGLILYDWPETTWVAEGVLAVPWWRVC